VGGGGVETGGSRVESRDTETEREELGEGKVGGVKHEKRTQT